MAKIPFLTCVGCQWPLVFWWCVEFLEKVDQKTSLFPDEEDLAGSAEALLRIQDVYALSADRMAHGHLHQDITNTASMTGKFTVVGLLQWEDGRSLAVSILYTTILHRHLMGSSIQMISCSDLTGIELCLCVWSQAFLMAYLFTYLFTYLLAVYQWFVVLRSNTWRIMVEEMLQMFKLFVRQHKPFSRTIITYAYCCKDPLHCLVLARLHVVLGNNNMHQITVHCHAYIRAWFVTINTIILTHR